MPRGWLYKAEMEALLHNACISFGAASFTVVFIILDMLRISIFQLRCVLVEWVSSSCLVKFVAAHWLIIAPPILWAICLSREFSLVRSVGDCESRLNIVWLGRNIWSKLETRNTRGMKFLPHTWDDVSCCYRQFQGWSFHWFSAMIIAEAGILITRAHLWKE